MVQVKPAKNKVCNLHLTIVLHHWTDFIVTWSVYSLLTIKSATMAGTKPISSGKEWTWTKEVGEKKKEWSKLKASLR